MAVTDRFVRFCDRMVVTIDDDESVAATDDGRGIPVDVRGREKGAA